MGQIWMPGGGGGADLDAVTATAADVLTGKVIVDAEGNPLNGTMPNKTGTALTVPTNGKILIPKGYHDGTQYAANTQATMAGKTITPSSSAQTVACSGKLMSGNIVVGAIPSKYVDVSSGVTVFHDGTLNKTFLPQGFKDMESAETVTYDSNGVCFANKNTERNCKTPITGNTINLTPFKKLTITIIFAKSSSPDYYVYYYSIYSAGFSSNKDTSKYKLSGDSYEEYSTYAKRTHTFTIDISSINQQAYICCGGYGYDSDDEGTSYPSFTGYITSIKLS